MPANFQVLPQVGAMRDRLRSPMHSFNVKTSPFIIQPMCIAPVLPGDRLESLTYQSRVVTDPVKNKLTGWWLNYMFFYVKLTDLVEHWANIKPMFTDGINYNWDNIDAASASTFSYTFAGGADWVKYCRDRVVETYFRDDGETYSTAAGLIGGRPSVHWDGPGWTDSLINFADYDASDADIVVEGPDTDTDIEAHEIVEALRRYEIERLGMTDEQSFEEFLAANYKVRTPHEDLHEPELIHKCTKWQYPVNTIDPADGSAATAISWVVKEHYTKKMFFKEPGFIFGVTWAKPKIYFGRQLGHMAGAIRGVRAWLPGVLDDDPTSSLIHFADSATPGTANNPGPLGAAMADTGGYFADIKDLYVRGDQFFAGHTLASDQLGEANIVALPATSGLRNYGVAADISNLFVTATTAEFVHHDGIVIPRIRSKVRDTSASGWGGGG